MKQILKILNVIEKCWEVSITGPLFMEYIPIDEPTHMRLRITWLR